MGDVILAFALYVFIPGLPAIARALFEIWTQPEEIRLGTT